MSVVRPVLTVALALLLAVTATPTPTHAAGPSTAPAAVPPPTPAARATASQGAAPAGLQATAASNASQGAATRHRFQAKKVVGALVNAIRYDRRTLAPKVLGFATMGNELLGATASELTPTEREQFTADFAKLLVATAFLKGHDLFAYLDGVLYGDARQDNAFVRLPSTIVVHRNLKKTEIAVEWVLAIDGDGLKVVDVVSQGESTLVGIREGEVLPLLKEGGKAKLLAALHDKAADVPSAPSAPPAH